MELSDILGGSGGLLNPDQQNDVNRQTLMGIAASLLKSAGPSPYKAKMTTLSGLGDALSAGLAGRQTATDEVLKRNYLAGQVRQQATGQTMQALQLAAQYRSLNLPVPPQVQRILDAANGGAGTAGGGVAAAGGSPYAAAQPGQPTAQPTPAFAPGASGGFSPATAPAFPPGGSGALPWPQPNATDTSTGAISPAGATSLAPAPQNPPTVAARSPGGVLSSVQSLPVQDRWGLIAGGPLGKIVEAVTSKNLETTPDQKNATASGKASPFQYNADLEGAKTSPDERAAKAAGMTLPEYTANMAVRNAVASAKGKRMAEAIEAGGKPARDTLNTLNVMGYAVERGGANISTGPGSEEWLKVKQFAKNLGFEPEGTTESEILKKMNIFLATEATKQISARPAMFEFQQNLKANPGLANSLDGTKALINILRQTTMQNIALGKLAMDEKNAPKWGDVEEKFYSDPNYAIRSPFTGAVLGAGNSDGAPPGAAPNTAPLAPAGQGPAAAQPAPSKGGPPVGYVDGRHRFLGGNPNDPSSWETVGATMPIKGVR